MENVTNAHGDDKTEDDEFVNANLDIDKTKEIPLNEDLDNDSELGASSVRSRKLTEKGQEENLRRLRNDQITALRAFPANGQK